MNRGLKASARRAAMMMLAASALLAGCRTAPPKPDAAAIDSAVRQLIAQADAWDKAIVAKDVAAIVANLASDFKQIESGGAVVGRDEFVKDLLDPTLRIDPYKVEDFGVRLYGDTALLTGRIRMTGLSEGKPFTSHFRYIDVYVRRAGVWKVVSIQITRMRD